MKAGGLGFKLEKWGGGGGGGGGENSRELATVPKIPSRIFYILPMCKLRSS